MLWLLWLVLMELIKICSVLILLILFKKYFDLVERFFVFKSVSFMFLIFLVEDIVFEEFFLCGKSNDYGFILFLILLVFYVLC